MYFVHPSQFSDVCVCARVHACVRMHVSSWQWVGMYFYPPCYSFLHSLITYSNKHFFPRIFYSPGIMVAAEFLFVL